MPPADENEFGVFCELFYNRISSVFEISNVKFWQDLPTFFGLPEWETLTRDELDM